MRSQLPLFKVAAAFLVASVIMGNMGTEYQTSEAAKKKKGADAAQAEAAQAEAELQKTLEPLNTTINDLMIKLQSRGLFSPKDAGQLAEVRFKLLDLISQFPQAPALAKPAYQAGVLFSEREDVRNAYELFSFLAASFPVSPYGLKAKGEIAQLEKRYGADYFPRELTQSLAAPAQGEEKAADPAKKDAKK